jgi:hypothetical protein
MQIQLRSLIFGLVLAVTLLATIAVPVFAAPCGNIGKGQGGGGNCQQIPEVPIAALYPAVGIGIVGAVWYISRRKGDQDDELGV